MSLEQAPRESHSIVSELLLKKNDMATNVARIFPLVWSNKSLPVDLLLYDEFNFIPMRSLR